MTIVWFDKLGLSFCFYSLCVNRVNVQVMAALRVENDKLKSDNKDLKAIII